MNKPNIQLWVDALRSGKYQQGKLRLRPSMDEFCCLGVVCDLYDPALWEDNDSTDFIFDWEESTLPDKVIDWLELRDHGTGTDGDIKVIIYKDNIPFATTLAGLNDSGYTFLEIADIIEKNFLNKSIEEPSDA